MLSAFDNSNVKRSFSSMSAFSCLIELDWVSIVLACSALVNSRLLMVFA
nr:MAG TPA: hypothetical protein [Caudoviricetes sp.]